MKKYNTILKFGSMVKLIVLLSFPLYFVERYVFNDWQFAIFFSVLFLVGTFLGLLRHILKPSQKDLAITKYLVKVMLYICCMILGHIAKYFEVEGHPVFVFQWANSVIYSAMIVREIVGAISNIAIIDPDVLPAWIIRKFMDYDKGTGIKDMIKLNPINEAAESVKQMKPVKVKTQKVRS